MTTTTSMKYSRRVLFVRPSVCRRIVTFTARQVKLPAQRNETETRLFQNRQMQLRSCMLQSFLPVCDVVIKLCLYVTLRSAWS